MDRPTNIYYLRCEQLSSRFFVFKKNFKEESTRGTHQVKKQHDNRFQLHLGLCGRLYTPWNAKRTGNDPAAPEMSDSCVPLPSK